MAKTKMQQVWDMMIKQYGDDGLCLATDVADVEVISSGSHALNDAVGIFGFPRGRLVQFAGKEASGKTFVSLMTIKEWQKQHPDNWCLFIDASIRVFFVYTCLRIFW